jgi:hypothetical protein
MLEGKCRFWSLLEPFTSQRILHMKNLTTFFSDGFGKEFFIHGLVSFWKFGILKISKSIKF